MVAPGPEFKSHSKAYDLPTTVCCKIFATLQVVISTNLKDRVEGRFQETLWREVLYKLIKGLEMGAYCSRYPQTSGPPNPQGYVFGDQNTSSFLICSMKGLDKMLSQVPANLENSDGKREIRHT